MRDRLLMVALATVHAVAVELMSEGAEVSVDGVRTALAKDKTWSKKLNRPNFTNAMISKALETLSLLRLLDQDFSDREGSTD